MAGLFSKTFRCDRQFVFRLGLLALALPCAGCESYTSLRQSASESLGSGRTFAIAGLEGRWAGDVTPQRPDCGSQTRGSMTISSHGFAFDPFGSTFVINGTISDSGVLDGTLKRVVSGEGSKHVERSLHFAGNGVQPDDGNDRITGRLDSGRCTWQVALQRA